MNTLAWAAPPLAEGVQMSNPLHFPNALFEVLFFLVASAVCLSSLMVLDALQLVNDFRVYSVKLHPRDGLSVRPSVRLLDGV